jgi:L-asparaginase/Glu-tRNA(Gln) amidotransferase subunit D
VRGRLCRDQTCANKEHDTVVVSDHGSGQALALVSGTLDRLHSATQYTYVHATRINEFKSATERSECSEHEARRRGSRRPVDLRLKDVKTLQTRSPRGMIAYFAFPGGVQLARSVTIMVARCTPVVSHVVSAPGWSVGRFNGR